MRSYIKFYSWSMLWIIPLSLVFSLGQFDTSSIIMFVIASLGIPLGLKAVPRLAGQFDFHLGKGHYTYSWLWWNLFFFFGVAVYLTKRANLFVASLGIDHVSCGGTHDRYGETIRLLDGT